MIKLPESTLKLRLEKEMYQEAARLGLTFSDYLETLDPTTPDMELDAFERQLARFGIVTQGPNAARLEAFFQTTESRVLFPEFINRNVRVGLETGKNHLKLEDIVAERTQIDGLSYNPTYLEEEEPKKKGAARVGELGSFPVSTIKLGEKTVTVKKFGRTVKASYEALKFAKLNVVSLKLKRIGTQIRDQMLEWATHVIINGDGNVGAAPQDDVKNPGNLTYDDLVDFNTNFDPYESSLWYGPKEVVRKILKLPEFKDAFAGFNYQKTGELISPMGNTLKFFKKAPANKLIGLDKDYALELVLPKGWQMMTETDKVISGQWQQIVISFMAGFSILFGQARRILNIGS